MKSTNLALAAVLLAALSLLTCVRSGAMAAEADSTVTVKFDGGDTEVDTVKNGVRFCIDQDFTYNIFPDELNGLVFTRRTRDHTKSVTLDVPKGSAVYAMFGDGGGGSGARDAAMAAGFKKVGPLHLTNGNGLLIYKLVANENKHLTLKGAGPYGIVIAAKKLDVSVSDAVPGGGPLAGPSTRPAMPQTSIKSLEVYIQNSGMMLGQTSEVVLTISRGSSPKETAVQFVTPVGSQMRLARDEAMRFIHLTYPNWDVKDAEVTFEDKYVAHDGGSIGAALGTMVLSVIEGFHIDPNVAITGDISANGKVRAIGGVSAKIRGAIASKCTIVALPLENEGQVTDTVIYYSPEMVTDVQVIGISNLADAVSSVRIDRAPKLTEAIQLFAAIQKTAKEKPDYLKSKDAQEKLAKILVLEPQHLSARILLSIAQGKLSRTLSATATLYYTAVATRPVLDVLKDKGATATRQVPSVAVQAGLRDLKRIRQLADPNVRPFVDAWQRYFEAWSAIQQGSGSSQVLEQRKQAVIEEMVKEQADVEMMQKMLKEGV